MYFLIIFVCSAITNALFTQHTYIVYHIFYIRVTWPINQYTNTDDNSDLFVCSLRKCLSLSVQLHCVCVFVLRTHTLPEVWVFLRLEWALNPYAVLGTACHGLALPVTAPVLAPELSPRRPSPSANFTTASSLSLSDTNTCLVHYVCGDSP